MRIRRSTSRRRRRRRRVRLSMPSRPLERCAGGDARILLFKCTRVSENKIYTENNELIYIGVFPRRRASPRAVPPSRVPSHIA